MDHKKEIIKKIIYHPLSWLVVSLLIFFFAFIFCPVATDTGEESEAEEAHELKIEELNAVKIPEDSLLQIAPEQIDETEIQIDTFEKEKRDL
ncbi:MAG: hypothetical protein DHS20C18_42930 [Saprospiraceae bacterium]|nr:MAG: hypothetical protein DHS20C18_42930 [Saprospiraceae bacterium]